MSGLRNKRPLPSTVSVVASDYAVRREARMMVAMNSLMQEDSEAEEDMQAMPAAA